MNTSRFASPPLVTTPIEVKQLWLDWHPSSSHIILVRLQPWQW